MAAEKWDLAKTAVVTYTNYTGKVTTWKAAVLASDLKVRVFDTSKALMDALKAVYDAKLLISAASAKAVEDGVGGVGAKKNWETKKAISDQALITYNSKKVTADANALSVTSTKTIYDGQLLEEAS